MFEDIYNKIYPSAGFVFIEEAVRNLEFILKDKINHIYKSGLDLVLEVSESEASLVIKELIENPELKMNSLSSINAYKANKKNYMIINLSSTTKGFSILLKIEVPAQQAEKSYIKILNVLNGFYKTADFYQLRDKTLYNNSDIRILPGILDGQDCFDIYIRAEGDMIEDALINRDISRVVNSRYYKDMTIFNLIAAISRFDCKAGIFPEICLCGALEELLQLKITGRARYIRLLLGELYRISNHIYLISNICNVLQHDIAHNLSLLERERTLRLIETITGSRVLPNYIRIGGVRKDLNREILIGIKKNLPILFKNLKRIEKILMNDFMVIERLKDTGLISREIALEYGITGPNLRASGVRYDLRKDKDPISYKDLSFTVPAGRKGDCLDRILVRFAEMFQSLRLINQIINNLPSGDHIKKINLSHLEFQPGMISYGVECPHGLFKIFMEVGERKINSLIVMGPSLNSLILSEKILKGSRIEDVNLVLASLDISPGEIMHT